MSVKNLVGQQFGRLRVLRDIGERKRGCVLWLCKCDCGNICKISSDHLQRNKNTKSCGCLHKETAKKQGEKNKTHGLSKTKIYHVWNSLIQRCYDTNCDQYKNYGGRGITVCQKWKKSFLTFYKDMGKRPKGMQIDRINNDRNYEPSNCRWATAKQNSRNRRNNHNITFNNKTQCIAAWAEELGINYGTLKTRLNKYYWSIEKTLTTPIQKRRK